jgi:hypothetical protein
VHSHTCRGKGSSQLGVSDIILGSTLWSLTDAAFCRSADVVAVPGDSLRDVGVDAAGDEEDSNVFYDVVLAGDQHDEAD